MCIRDRLIVGFLFLGINLEVIAGDIYSKKIQKTFQVKDQGKLTVKNRYGKVHITSSPNTSEISITVEVSLKAKNDEKGNQMLECVGIDLSQTDYEVKAITQLNSGKKPKCKSYSELKIDYTITMPENHELQLENKYGNVYINELANKTDVYVAYGDMRIGELKDESNKMKVAYGDFNLKKANYLELEAKYSDGEIEEVKLLVLKSRYSDLEIGGIGRLELNSMYGDMKIDAVAQAQIEARYTDFRIKYLTQSAFVDMQYGDCKIYEIEKDFSQIDADLGYTDLVLNFNDGAVFNLETDLNYADVSLPGKIEVTSDIKNSNNRAIKAHMVSSDAVSKVKIKSNYGNIIIE